MKLEYTGKETKRFVGGIRVIECKKGDVIDVTDARAKKLLDASPKLWKKVKDKPNEEGEE